MGRRRLNEITFILKKATKEMILHWKDLFKISIVFFIMPMFIGNFLIKKLLIISNDKIISLEFVSIIIVLLYDMGLMASIKLIHERNKGNKFCWKSSNNFVLRKFWEIALMSGAIWVIDIILILIINNAQNLLNQIYPNFSVAITTNLKLLVQCIALVYLSMSMKALITKELGVIESIKYSIKVIRGRFIDASIKIAILFAISYFIKGALKVFAILPIVNLMITTVPKFYIDLYKEIAKGVMLEQYNTEK